MKLAQTARVSQLEDSGLRRRSSISGWWGPVVGHRAGQRRGSGTCIDPNRPIIVRAYDLDGWVLRHLARGRLAAMLEKEYAEPMKNWAVKRLNPKATEVDTGNVPTEILQEKQEGRCKWAKFRNIEH